MRPLIQQTLHSNGCSATVGKFLGGMAFETEDDLISELRNCALGTDNKRDEFIGLTEIRSIICLRLRVARNPSFPAVATVDTESTLRSAVTLLSRVRASPPVTWPDGGPGSQIPPF
ncbi:hypothetical protein PoB_002650400 [Plakobranchus ocellatus]|uniref:Uncharacterized protein n=1 Tax=Plakobranchus ocellatus TaxID=259542 RepID=A0AAV4A1B5_9GAST|nr:hypothetical protein PoB_002650400 [Plakobranchus ocellatus]